MYENWLLSQPNDWLISYIFDKKSNTHEANLHRENFFYEFFFFASEYYDVRSKKLLRRCINQAIAEAHERYGSGQLDLKSVNLHHVVGMRAQRLLHEQLLAKQKLEKDKTN